MLPDSCEGAPPLSTVYGDTCAAPPDPTTPGPPDHRRRAAARARDHAIAGRDPAAVGARVARSGRGDHLRAGSSATARRAALSAADHPAVHRDGVYAAVLHA